jgi:hypothetical protein
VVLFVHERMSLHIHTAIFDVAVITGGRSRPR